MYEFFLTDYPFDHIKGGMTKNCYDPAMSLKLHSINDRLESDSAVSMTPQSQYDFSLI